MSIIDDLKDTLGIHAAILSERMAAVENQLDGIREGSNRMADMLDFETYQVKLVIPAGAAKGFANFGKAQKLFEVPEGAFYELIGWTSLSNEPEVPVLFTNGVVFDIPNTYQTPKKLHKSTSQGLIISPREWLEAINTETETETVLWLQFKVYKKAPAYVAATGSGG